ncbi:MAG: hypothetical protein KI790_11120 [Cyclobacteriaceae bacterium]|nr:hypothetical protein [Cyclobacteriaceae bacterium HetDA_MAG_MS6]
MPEHLDIDNVSFDLISDQNGLLGIANRSGVLLYDGKSWDFFPTPSAALSLGVDENNTIYVGCVGQFGKLGYQGNAYEYIPLFATDSVTELFGQTIVNEGKAHFLGNETLHVYDIEDQELSQFAGDFVNIYKLDSQVYINTYDSAFLVNGDSLVFQQTADMLAYSFSSQDKDFVSDLEGRIYQQAEDGLKLLPHNQSLESRGLSISEAVAVNDTLIACSTLASGTIFLNVNDTSYLKVVDYYTGLPDNEIFAIHADGEGGVWVSHEFGLTRISPLFPAHSYSHYPGLEGNLFSTAWIDGTLWVSSSLGVYYFDKDTTFTEKVYYVARKRRTPTPVQQKTRSTPENKVRIPLISKPSKSSAKSKDASTKKPFLKKLFKKKKRALQEPTTPAVAKETPKPQSAKKNNIFKKITSKVEDLVGNNIEKIKGKPKSDIYYVRRTRKIPERVTYQFSKVPNANGKFKDLVPFGDKVLAASTSGVFEVSQESSSLVIDEPVRSINYLTHTDRLLVNTYNQQMKLYSLQEDAWVELDVLELDDVILSSFEDEAGAIWMVGTASIFKVQQADDQFVVEKDYDVNNRFFDIMDVILRRDTLTFINSQGYFYLDSEEESIKENISLTKQIGMPKSHFRDQQGNVWVFNGKVWFRISTEGLVVPFEYLSIFQDLRFISFDEQSDRYWLITKDNELLNYDVRDEFDLGTRYQMFLKRISNQAGAVDPSGKFSFGYDENRLSFELSKPDYIGFLNMEYQYKLQGLQSDWSDWSANNIIDFSYLPPGSYRLRVRTRDAFDRSDERELIAFKISAPYWQQPWFYALQIIFFGALVVVSTRLNQSKTQNQLLSEGLTILTIILVIEFLQSAIGSYLNIKSSPVVDFLVDASIALMIFPLERLLRILMTGGKAQIPVDKLKKIKLSVNRK